MATGTPIKYNLIPPVSTSNAFANRRRLSASAPVSPQTSLFGAKQGMHHLRNRPLKVSAFNACELVSRSAERILTVQFLFLIALFKSNESRLHHDIQRRSPSKKQPWLSWDFDESVPARVQRSGWALKVLDVVDAVVQSDVTMLQSSLERYHSAVNRKNTGNAETDTGDAEGSLIRDFEEAWRRSEQQFRAKLRNQDDEEVSPNDIDLQREVSNVLQGLRGSGMDGNAPENVKDDREPITVETPINGHEERQGSIDVWGHKRLGVKSEEADVVLFPEPASARQLIRKGFLFQNSLGEYKKLGMVSHSSYDGFLKLMQTASLSRQVHQVMA